MERKVISVTAVNEYIKSILDSDAFLSSVWIEGEISNFNNHYKTGHFYFSVKDEGGVLKAVMFRSYASKLPFMPENGMKVLIRGRISAYPRDGSYQIYCEEMEPDGVGSLYFAFEQLKKKLGAEGLFAPERKRPLPKIPKRIGVITSPTGAAVRDIINILGRRFPYAEAVLYPVLVQGADAPPQLIRAVEYFSSTKCVDVVIIGRGGGSIEDLWAFNNEELARAIAASEIPIISAVGHETDFTICDFVSDRRAPTPSAAAELAVPETAELMHRISNVNKRNELLLSQKISRIKERLTYLTQLTSPKNILHGIDEKRILGDMYFDRMLRAIERSNERGGGRLAELSAKLGALSPLSILERGYSVALQGEKTLKSVEQVSLGDSFTLRLRDGEIDATVNGVNSNK